jgi:DNA-binding PadR family transcriptional regulator
VAGLFGLANGEQQRGPRVRRGDVRSAILDVLAGDGESSEGERLNGYQVITQIAERSGGAWKPSPGSVYPTINQLEDEGLVEADETSGRRTMRLTDAGWEYVVDHRQELDAVWQPFAEETGRRREGPDYAQLKPEIGRLMSAVWQIATQGSDQQRAEAIDALVETRRKLYGILAEGDAQ